MGSFSADAVLVYGFADDKADVHFFTAATQEIKTDFSSFTADATDPDAIRSNGNGDEYAGWIGLDLLEDTRLQIYTKFGPGDVGMVDTLLAIWGPRTTPPGAINDPWHLGDDNFASGYLSSLHDVGGSDPYGTDYVDGYRHSTDEQGAGILLPAGKYWIAVWPYDSAWDASEGLVYLQIAIPLGFTADAVIKGPITGGFAADALVAALSFTADAWIAAPRWTHDRVRDHHGVESDLYVALSADIGPYVTYTPIHYVLEGLHARLVQLESSNRIRSSFTADAVISDDAFTADAVIYKSSVLSGSLTADAVVIRGGSFTADALIQGGLTADAFIVAAL